MSFLKFLKSTKKKPKFEFPKADLDIPPAPPSDVPSFPSTPEPEMPPELAMPEDIPPEMPPSPEMPEMAMPEEPEVQFEEPAPEFEDVVPRQYDTDKPIFVEVQRYKALMDEINSAKNKLKESTDVLQRIMDLRDDEDNEYTNWHSALEDIQRKLVFVDKTLFRG